MSAITFANRFSPDRSVTVGVLGLRTARYIREGQQVVEGIPGLTIRSSRAPERPFYHPTTGVYGFVELPSGPNRIHVEDPLGRFLPTVLEPEVVPREAERRAMENGRPQPGAAFYRIISALELRPAIGMPFRAGETAVWGRVVDSDGSALPFARLTIETRFEDTPASFIAFSDVNGVYFAPLPGERTNFVLPEGGDPDEEPDPIAALPVDEESSAELTFEFQRELQAVHRLEASVLADFRERAREGADPLPALPPDFDTRAPADLGSPYVAHTGFQIRAVGPATDPVTRFTISVGRRVRWDIHLN